MKIFDYSEKTVFEEAAFPRECRESSRLFILCRTHEVQALRDVFGFDESTVLDCTDLDESVRYTSFDGYDFISIVHIELLGNEVRLREINLYISSRYLVLVMPEHESPRLSAIEQKLLNSADMKEERSKEICGLYFLVFHHLLSDFSDTLETLEDRMEALSDEIVMNANQAQFAQINILRSITYAAKKQLRALSYLGDQILLDENKLIGKNHMNYFRNVSTRLKKLYDFSESLYHLGGEILYSYDSRLSMKTNDTVNKLTALTLLFGPLTVITGIYGMNFDFMPELRWPFSYPLTLIVMVGISLSLVIIMKRKKWL